MKTQQRKKVAALADYLEREDLSDGEFGRLIGVPSQTVLHWRHGNKIPNRENMRRIMTVTGGAIGPAVFYE